jgi:mRNA-degrading endonuclease YafQ of YafQ-DinJ toxin-antitoxin module
MTPAGFTVFATARFERDYRSLLKRHPKLPGDYAAVLAALKHNPHNRARRYRIKKLEDVAPGDRQFRICHG